MKIYLTFAGALCCAPIILAQDLTNGATQTGTLTALASNGIWAVNATNGNHIAIEIAKTSGGALFAPQIQIFAPSGEWLGQATGNSAARLDIQAGETGAYTVQASGGNGAYQLELAQIPGNFIVSPGKSGGALTNGAVQTGTLAAGDLNLWTFQAAANSRIVAQIAKLTGGAAFVPMIELFGPDGTRLEQANGTTAARINAQAQLTGTYTLLVSAQTPGVNGAYQLQLAQVPEAAVLSPGQTGGELSGTTNGNIGLGDLNIWNFAANTGDVVTMTVSKLTGGATFTPQIELFLPTGDRRAIAQNTSTASVSLAVENAGTYSVIVSDANTTGTGTYQLQLTRASATLGASVLTNGIITVGAVTTVGQTNLWSFLATAGDPIILRTGTIGTERFVPWLQLWNPNGAQVGQVSLAPGSELAVMATNTGVFTVGISDGSAGRAQTGNYEVTLVKPGSLNSATDLTNGLAESGSIAVGDLDVWTFVGNAGQTAVVRMGKLVGTATLTPYLRLYGPDGSLLSQFGVSAAAAEVANTLTNSGTYTVVASDNSSYYAGFGSYRIKLAQTGTPVEIAPNDNGGALTNGLGATGEILVGDIQPWTFIAEAGQSIVVRMGTNGANTGFTPYLRLYDPSGALLNQFGVSPLASEVSTQATNSGTFTVLATDNSSYYVGTGVYRIKLAQTGTPIKLGLNDNGGALTNGYMNEGTSAVGDMGVWSVAASNGQSIVARMGKLVTTDTLTPYLRLYDPSGALLSQFGVSGAASEVSTRATNTGNFLVIASDNTSYYAGRGTYRLKLGQTGSPIVLAAGDAGGQLTNGYLYTGDIQVGDMDVWQFPATTNQTVIMRMGKLVTTDTLTPYLRLYDPSGALLSQFGISGAASEVSAKVTNNGMMTVLATDNSSYYAGDGTYAIKLAQSGAPIELAAGDDGGAFNGTAQYTGTIEVGGVDLWEFTACAGNTITVVASNLTSGETLTPWLRLYDRAGTLVENASGFPDTHLTTTAPNSGTYTVVLTDNSSYYVGSGNYQLTVNGLSTGLKLCDPEPMENNVLLSGVGGTALSNYVLLTSTTLKTNGWTPVETNTYDVYGGFEITNALDINEAARFFKVEPIPTP